MARYGKRLSRLLVDPLQTLTREVDQVLDVVLVEAQAVKYHDDSKWVYTVESVSSCFIAHVFCIKALVQPSVWSDALHTDKVE